MVTSSYRTIAGEARAQIEIKRSVFLARLVRVDDEESARVAIAAARAEHPRARHHCTAMILGPRGQLERSSDDGEPAGTAGAPMLEVLRGAQFSDVLAVVTRWFGGTLLGAGGLVRAYSDAVKAALEEARVVRRELQAQGAVTLSHADAGRVENDLRTSGVPILGTEYGSAVTLRIGHTPDDAARIADLVAAVTGGEGELREEGQTWVDVPG